MYNHLIGGVISTGGSDYPEKQMPRQAVRSNESSGHCVLNKITANSDTAQQRVVPVEPLDAPFSEEIVIGNLKQETLFENNPDETKKNEETKDRANSLNEPAFLYDRPIKESDLCCKYIFSDGPRTLSRRTSAIDFFTSYDASLVTDAYDLSDVLSMVGRYASNLALDDRKPLLDRLYLLGEEFHDMRRFITGTFPDMIGMGPCIAKDIKRPLCTFLSLQAQHKLFKDLIENVQSTYGGYPVSYHDILAAGIRTGEEQVSEAFTLTVTQKEHLYQRIFGSVPFTADSLMLPDLSLILPESVMTEMNHHKRRFENLWAQTPDYYTSILSRTASEGMSQTEAMHLSRYLNDHIPAITLNQYTHTPLRFVLSIHFCQTSRVVRAEYDLRQNEILCYTYPRNSHHLNSSQLNWYDILAHEAWHTVQYLSNNTHNNRWNFRSFANDVEKTKKAIREFSIAAMGRSSFMSHSTNHIRVVKLSRRSSLIESESYYMHHR